MAGDVIENYPTTVNRWLEDALGRYQVTHIHGAIREAMKLMGRNDSTAEVAAHPLQIEVPERIDMNPQGDVDLPTLVDIDEDLLVAQRAVASEYGTDWQGLCDSAAVHCRATDICMDLARTEAALMQRHRQLRTQAAEIKVLKARQAELQAAVCDWESREAAVASEEQTFEQVIAGLESLEKFWSVMASKEVSAHEETHATLANEILQREKGETALLTAFHDHVKLQAQNDLYKKWLILKDCTVCQGSGWFTDSCEGGMQAMCNCWANRLGEVRKLLAAKEAELSEMTKNRDQWEQNYRAENRRTGDALVEIRHLKYDITQLRKQVGGAKVLGFQLAFTTVLGCRRDGHGEGIRVQAMIERTLSDRGAALRMESEVISNV